MSRIPELKKERNDAIKKKYAELAAKQTNGVQLYRHEAICHILGKKFFLAPLTIQNIVSDNDSKPGENVDPNQTNIFDQIKDQENEK
ncbi:MAG: hypothetical protein L6Q66_09195 [Bacteroidia bacterium]|nr:hypothetical protein [Bacteroidia bacterium]